jgi:uncharacterized protein with HEPN domain
VSERCFADALNDMIRNLELAVTFARDVSYEEFERDERINYAVIRALEIVGESAKRIPEDFRAKHDQIPWKAMSGMRDRLIHAYDRVNLSLVWATITETAPKYLLELKRLKPE